MVKYYMLKQPNPKDPKLNYYLLYVASKHKRSLIGVYYIPSRKALSPVFKARPGEYFEEGAFEEIKSKELEESYKMICIPGCGWCCERNSGAFAFEHEMKHIVAKLYGGDITNLEMEIGRPIDMEWVDTLVGPKRIYRLDLGPAGRCIFYRDGKCVLDTLKVEKPIICLVTYCSLYAEKGGKKYIKVAVKKAGDLYIPVYREVSDEEFERIVKRLQRTRQSSQYQIRGYSSRYGEE